MSFELDTSDLEAAYDDLARDETRELAGWWFSESQEVLFATGDEFGWDVSSVAQAATPPQWDASREGFAFRYLHEAARYLNDGTAPHEIEATRADTLAFEWEDAPREVRDMFEETFPTVFFQKIEHPGTPAIMFIERGEQKAISQWENAR